MEDLLDGEKKNTKILAFKLMGLRNIIKFFTTERKSRVFRRRRNKINFLPVFSSLDSVFYQSLLRILAILEAGVHWKLGCSVLDFINTPISLGPVNNFTNLLVGSQLIDVVTAALNSISRAYVPGHQLENFVVSECKKQKYLR